MHNRYPRKPRTPLRAISVARTVEAPQPEFEHFLSITGKHLSSAASIYTAASTRVTFLESGGIQKALKKRKSEPRDAKQFSYWFSARLDSYRDHGIEVDIDPEQRIKLYGRQLNKLALKIAPNQELTEERRRAEALLIERFGSIPPLKDFEPHISFGSLHRGQVSEDELANPELLIPPDVIPGRISLNGLCVFVDGRGLKH